jgi:hypothetical protein
MIGSCKGSLAKLANYVRVVRLRDEQEGQERFLICRRHGACTGQLAGVTSEHLGLQAQVVGLCGTELPCHLVEQQLGAGRMLAHTALATLPELDPRGGQSDETLEEIGYPPTSARGVPKPLPSLVRLPIIPTIQEVNAVQIGSAVVPPIGVECYPGLRQGTANESKKKAMPGPVAGRMRVFATRVGVGGQWKLGGEPRNASKHKRCTSSDGCWGPRGGIVGGSLDEEVGNPSFPGSTQDLC